VATARLDDLHDTYAHQVNITHLPIIGKRVKTTNIMEKLTILHFYVIRIMTPQKPQILKLLFCKLATVHTITHTTAMIYLKCFIVRTCESFYCLMNIFVVILACRAMY